MELNKRLDQFFLNNSRILEKEVELAELDKNETVLEIGAGDGRLTRLLSKHSNVVAIEIDRRFAPLLGKISCKTIYGDALKIIPKLDFDKVVSNIPYSLSQPILMALLKKKWKIAVLIVQKEFAQKLLEPGDKLYLVVNDCCNVAKIMDVPAGEFEPTAIDSMMILLEQKKTMDDNFWMFLTSLFRHKNKVIKSLGKRPRHLTVEEAMTLFDKTI
ncbi:MAG: rRNA adenine N-6-methyltransferase family protein [Candidatus Aenigmatarchaeota archaeon]